jgi:hypothetical protein
MPDKYQVLYGRHLSAIAQNSIHPGTNQPGRRQPDLWQSAPEPPWHCPRASVVGFAAFLGSFLALTEARFQPLSTAHRSYRTPLGRPTGKETGLICHSPLCFFLTGQPKINNISLVGIHHSP